jgi:hypothetical protein
MKQVVTWLMRFVCGAFRQAKNIPVAGIFPSDNGIKRYYTPQTSKAGTLYT